MNIRYRFKHNITGIIRTEIFSLRQVEEGVLDSFDRDWRILSRDLGTGLKDRNGVEIFEGDIVVFDIEDHDACKSKVFFEQGCFSVYAYLHYTPCLGLVVRDSLEIIGREE